MSAAQKELFFERMEAQELALTYDDVRIRTRSNQHEPLPDILSIESQFSTNVELKVPFVSAAMDTVTNSDMAIAMAKLGGLGVIHAAMSIDTQRQEVRRVKKAVHGLIDKPITVSPYDTLQDVETMREENQFTFRTFPVIDKQGKLVGVITGNDFEYPDNLGVKVGEAMKPVGEVSVASRKTSLQEGYELMQARKINTLPLLTKSGKLKGMYLFSDVKRAIRDVNNYNVDDNHQLRTAAAVSTGKDVMERVEALYKYADVIVIDTADGDSYYAFETLRKIKQKYPDLDVVVGNISDGDSARELAVAGANGIKVGQGPGSICSTRRETGIGMPQVTAVWDAKKALGKKFAHIPVCADGGITQHGDIPIAIAARADAVMMGSKLAGTAEAPGKIIKLKNGTLVKVYRGMGSESALRDNEASRDRYGTKGGGKILPEGIEAYVPYVGSVEDVIGLCAAALRKGMSYAKSVDLADHQENARFKRITGSGLRESHPHDVEVIAA